MAGRGRAAGRSTPPFFMDSLSPSSCVRVIAFAVARPRYATIPSSHSNIRPKAVSHDTIRYDAAAALLVYRDVTKRGLCSAAVVVWEEIELLRCRPPTKKKGINNKINNNNTHTHPSDRPSVHPPGRQQTNQPTKLDCVFYFRFIVFYRFLRTVDHEREGENIDY